MSEDKNMKLILGVAFLVCLPIFFLLNGYTVMILWKWFVVPVGVPVITLWQAVGIDLLWTFMCPTPSNLKEGSEESVKSLIRGFVKPTVILLFAWIAHSLMIG